MMKQIKISVNTFLLVMLLVLLSPGMAFGEEIRQDRQKYSGENAALIGLIYQKSGILFTTNQGETEWQPAELKVFLELLALLPDEFKTLKTIRIHKKIKKSSRIYRQSCRKRSIIFHRTVSNPDRLRKCFLRQLTTFLDHDTKISEGWEWRKISRWTGWDLGGNSPENKNPRGYALIEGMKNPARDFITTVEMFFLPPRDRPQNEYLKYRIPSKYDFVRNLFKSRPDPQYFISYRDSYKKWVDPEQVKHLEILIASPSYASIASIAGHIFLCIRMKEASQKDLVVSFMANHMENRTEPDPDLEYILQGIFGKYNSHLLVESMEEMQYRYNVEENRDIIRVRLNFSPSMIERVIQRLWEMQTCFYYHYYFFTLNCTTMMTHLLNYVLPKELQIPDRDFYDLPYHIGSKIYQKGTGRIIHPKYLSISHMAKYSAIQNFQIFKRIKALFHSLNLEQPGKEILGLLNKINRNPASQSTLRLYEKLANAFSRFSFSSPAGTTTRKRTRQLLIDFLTHALEVEKFKVHTRFVLTKPQQGFMGFFYQSREFLLINDLIARLKKNPDYTALQSLTYLQNPTPQLTGYSKEEGRYADYHSGYSLYRISPRLYQQGNSTYPGSRFRFSTFYEKLGNNSNFSLSQDSSMEFITFGLDIMHRPPSTPNSTDRTWWTDYYFKYLEFEKIFTPGNLKSTNWFTPGLGLAFFESKSDRVNNIRLEVNLIRAKFLLNIYEVNNFSQFLNLKLGTGFSYFNTESSTVNFLDFSGELEGKINLGYRGGGALRYQLRYCRRFNFKEGNIWEVSARIATDWYLKSWKNACLSIGLDYGQKQIDILLEPGQGSPRKHLALNATLTFKGASPVRWINFKKIFNSIF